MEMEMMDAFGIGPLTPVLGADSAKSKLPKTSVEGPPSEPLPDVGPPPGFGGLDLEPIVKKVAGFADGIRCDVDGNIWASAGWVGDGYDGVHVFEPTEGVRIGQIRLPEICSNVCFGGTKRNRLFMTASTSVYAVYVETQGAHIT